MRQLIPVSQTTPEQLDKLREGVEANLILNAQRAHPEVKEWKTRQLLPWTDLVIVGAGQAGNATDFWGCQVLVASTPLVYVNNTRLQDTQFIGIYGIQIRDVNPCVIKVMFQTGAGASTKANWNVEIMYGSREPHLVTPEYIYYGGSEVVLVTLIPDTVGKAVGPDGVSDHVILEGLICMPAGDVISG